MSTVSVLLMATVGEENDAGGMLVLGTILVVFGVFAPSIAPALESFYKRIGLDPGRYMTLRERRTSNQWWARAYIIVGVGLVVVGAVRLFLMSR